MQRQPVARGLGPRARKDYGPLRRTVAFFNESEKKICKIFKKQ